jgi:hypothetical protein
VTLHTGDSHRLVPELLGQLTDAGTNVDFVLVDGDHSAGGVAQDMRDLLDSPAIGRTVIVMHDSMNEEVRRGLEAVDYDAYPKIRFVHLDCVSGFLYEAPLEGELWGGLAVVVVDADNPRGRGEPTRSPLYRPTHELVLSALRDAGDADAARAEAHRLRVKLAAVEGSRTWRTTEPLRALKRRLRG